MSKNHGRIIMTPTIKKKSIKMYKDTLDYLTVAKQLNIPAPTLYRFLKIEGHIVPNAQRARAEKLAKKAKKLYLKGFTIAYIEKELNLSRHWFRTIGYEQGWYRGYETPYTKEEKKIIKVAINKYRPLDWSYLRIAKKLRKTLNRPNLCSSTVEKFSKKLGIHDKRIPNNAWFEITGHPRALHLNRRLKEEGIKRKVYFDKKNRIRKMTAFSIRNYWNEINPNNIIFGKGDYELDHIFSVSEGIKQRIPMCKIAHPANLRIITRKANRLKRDCCDFTKNELYKAIKDFEEIHGKVSFKGYNRLGTCDPQ